ncbi:acyl-CoA thioesterase [Malassezia pachydermatis]|uniref:Peroxisomal acyl-coenzyme a thioester hydrolase 1 n=1 Tax=Malassezia pachydermatis TaxID=77020 RepID=A0A0M9VNJ4_9BASI|nr:peroxisomal acyl-coenzyme a thioester hydrolase 1 [Malassezia pachydermatis]KOS13182.1 peroxisomal acyl-coenzyme a thioester hydrolase 1 [Malassezia pachydermatis]
MSEKELSAEEWDERLSQHVDVRQTSYCEFESISSSHWVPVMGKSVFGGTLIAQSMKAATKTVSPEMELHEIHGKFLNRASHQKHIYYYVKKLRDGRSYMTRRVDAMQDQTLIFTATVSFQLPEPSQPQFYAPPPIIGATGTFKLMKFMPDGHSNLPTEVLLPDMCQPGSERYLKALEHTPKEAILHKYLTKYTNDQQNLPVEFRPAVPTVFDENGHIQYGTKLAYWLRARGHSPGSVNDQRAVLGFHIDQFMLGNMLANLREGPPSMMASLDHTMWFHNDFDMSNWLLMVVENQAASNGRALIMARVYRGDGVLVAIVIQEGVIRFPTGRL